MGNIPFLLDRWELSHYKLIINNANEARTTGFAGLIKSAGQADQAQEGYQPDQLTALKRFPPEAVPSLLFKRSRRRETNREIVTKSELYATKRQSKMSKREIELAEFVANEFSEEIILLAVEMAKKKGKRK